MKLSESQAFKLFDKYGIVHPRLGANFGKVVVKADIPMGGKGKAGLVVICSKDQIKDKSSEIKEKIKGMGYEEGRNVIIEEYIPHEAEIFVALKAVREGIEVYYSGEGGVDVEKNWEKVSRLLLDEKALAGNKWSLEKFSGDQVVREFVEGLVRFFQEEDATYLEINPFALDSTLDYPAGYGNVRGAVALGVVLELDEAAEWRHSDWRKLGIGNSPGRTERERKVREIDGQIKGSVKLVEVPQEKKNQIKDDSSEIKERKVGNGNGKKESELTAVMAGGAGAALFLCDAIINNGLTLANYAEFSGNPPNWALTELVKQVCAIPGIRNLVIGSGIANFTPAKANIEAIIDGLRQSPQAKNLNIVVRRCGPGEEEGIEIMRKWTQDSGYKIQVFGRETGMAEVVKKLVTNSN